MKKEKNPTNITTKVLAICVTIVLLVIIVRFAWVLIDKFSQGSINISIS